MFTAAILAQAIAFPGGVAGIAILNVLPFLAIHDQANFRLADSKLTSKLVLTDSAGGITSADVQNLAANQLVLRAAFSFSHATFGHHVGDVCGLGSEKQVILVDAWRVVAFVKYIHSAWNLAIDALVCHSVCADVVAAFHADNSVSSLSSSFPEYAAIRLHLSYVSEESEFEREPPRFSGTLSRAKPSCPAREIALQREEYAAAMFAVVRRCATFVSRHFGPPDRFGLFRGSRQLLAGGSLASFYHKEN